MGMGIGMGFGATMGIPSSAMLASAGSALGNAMTHAAPVRDGGVCLVLVHMVDGWVGAPGSDAWYLQGMDYDSYATLVLHKPSSICERAIYFGEENFLVDAAHEETGSSDPAATSDPTAGKKPKKELPGVPATDMPQPLEIGVRVYGRFQAGKKLYRAAVVGVRKRASGFSYQLEYDDGREENEVPPKYIRVLSEGRSELATSERHTVQQKNVETIAARPDVPAVSAPALAMDAPAVSTVSVVPVSTAKPLAKFSIGQSISFQTSSMAAARRGRITDVQSSADGRSFLYDLRCEGEDNLRERGIAEIDIQMLAPSRRSSVSEPPAVSSSAPSKTTDAPVEVSPSSSSAVVAESNRAKKEDTDLVASSSDPAIPASAAAPSAEDKTERPAAISMDGAPQSDAVDTTTLKQEHVDARSNSVNVDNQNVREAVSQPPAHVDMTGAALDVGDQVEASYKGKSKRFYRGTISARRIRESDNTPVFSIAYADGDKEDDALGKNIRLLKKAILEDAPKKSTTSTSLSSLSSFPTPTGATAASSTVAQSQTTSFDIGDKIDAKFKGRGETYFSGTISAVSKDSLFGDTYSILYDDGDKEDGALAKNIRLVEKRKEEEPASAPSTTPDPPSKPREEVFIMEDRAAQSKLAITSNSSATSIALDMDGKVLEVGDSIEARYKGKSVRYFPGKISVVSMKNGIATFDIAYDDGDKEQGAQGKSIRLIKKRATVESNLPESSSAAAVISSSLPAAPAPWLSARTDKVTAFSPGDKIEAKFKGRSAIYFPGVITAVTDDAIFGETYTILYDDGDKEDGAFARNIRLVEAAKKDTPAAFDAPNANIAETNTSASKDAKILSTLSSPESQLEGYDMDGNSISKGDKIEARYKGKSTRFFPGSISQVTSGEAGSVTFSIAYNDGDSESGALGKNIRLIEKASKPHAAPDLNPGVSDTMSSSASLMAIPSTSARSAVSASPSSAFRVGDKIEAKFKGRSSKFFPGVITAVTSDPIFGETFSILYDDGDKEDGAFPRNINLIMAAPAASSAGASSATEPVLPTHGYDTDGNTLSKGDKIEAKYKGRSTRYFPGQISDVHIKEGKVLFSIAYDDGDHEDEALGSNIRLVTKKSSAVETDAIATKSAPDDSSHTPAFHVGDKIEAKFKGRSSRFFPGTITAVTSDHVHGETFNIHYDDGANETCALAANIRLIEAGTQAPAPADKDKEKPTTKTSKPQPEDMNGKILDVGDKIEAKYKGKSTRYFRGEISAVRTAPDGAVTFGILYEDGDNEDGALGKNIRLLKKNPPSDTAAGESSSRINTSDIVIKSDKPEPAVEPPANKKTPPTDTDSNGASLDIGDKVKCKYKGKSSRYFPGIISSKSVREIDNVAVFSIVYDDGDKEDGALGKNIILVEKASAPVPKPNTGPESPERADMREALSGTHELTGVDMDGKIIGKGDNIEAKYKGKSKRFFPGQIAAVVVSPIGTTTFSILYDDGDKEDGAQSKDIRRIGASLHDESASGKFRVSFRDDQLEWSSDFDTTSRYKPGPGSKSNPNSTTDSNDAFPINRNAKSNKQSHTFLAAPFSSSGGPAGPRNVVVEPGDLLESIDEEDEDDDNGFLASLGSSLTKGKAGTSGTRGSWTPGGSNKTKPSSSSTGKKGKPTAGMTVQARDSFGQWKSGKITRVAPDGSYSIKYSDGDFDFGLRDDSIRV
jgi:hypothetical protein